MPVPVKPTMFNNNGNIMASPWEFKHRGQSGMEISELFPHIAEHADSMAVIRSMTSKVNEHAQAIISRTPAFPSWDIRAPVPGVSYGLGTENKDLPGFIVLQSGGATPPHGGVGVFSNGYLPGQHQASILKADGEEALPNIKPRESDAIQRQRLSFIKGMDDSFCARLPSRRSRPRSRITKPPIACRPPYPSCATSAGRARRRRSSTVSITRRPTRRPTAGNASWPGGSSNGGCASWS